MGQLLIRVKTWGDYTVVINRSSWDYKMLVYKCVRVCVTGGLQPDIPPTDHAPHWEMSRQSLFLRGFLLFCIFSQINTTQLLLITWQKLWVEIQNQGHVPLWAQRIFMLRKSFFLKMKLLSPRMLSSPFAFIIPSRTHVRELFTRVEVRFIIETWGMWWQFKIKSIDHDRKASMLFYNTITLLLH